MKEVLSWFVEHYELLILVGACLLDIVLFLFGVFKKKEPLFNIVYQRLPEFINEAEETGLSGDEKLKFVLDKALLMICYTKGCLIDDINKTMKKRIVDAIELILSTPQKKGK